eukprot:GILI01033580.1.p2 GENE.GILI01033580.1~~GILI01033580.1.p2  ORF type:complete len:122 (-),score=20.65 GILI01033580.1:249-614(-)
MVPKFKETWHRGSPSENDPMVSLSFIWSLGITTLTSDAEEGVSALLPTAPCAEEGSIASKTNLSELKTVSLSSTLVSGISESFPFAPCALPICIDVAQHLLIVELSCLPELLLVKLSVPLR